MKAFIEKVFKAKKLKKETEVKVSEQATEAMVEAIVEEVKEEIKEEAIIYPKPGHYFADCNCFKCIRWRNQNA